MSEQYAGYNLVPVSDITGPLSPCGPGRPIIDGLVPLNSWICGECEQDGQQYFIVFVEWFKEGDIENQDPYFATIKDMSLEAADAIMQEEGMILVLTEDDLDAKLHPKVKEIVEKDRSEGKKGNEIAETRADIIKKKFLGFKLEDLPEWAKQYGLDSEGKSFPKFQRCNLGHTVES